MRVISHSRQQWLYERFLARRYRARCARHEKAPTRGLRKHADRSRFESKASEMRREQEQYAQRRRSFLAWADSQSGTLGVVIPARRTRTGMEVRFRNLNPAVSLSMSAVNICGAVSYAGRHCDLRVFESEPRKVASGYVDDFLLREYVAVHPDLHALWRCEVFEYFQRWYADEFATATKLLLQYDERRPWMSASLYPGKYVSSREGHVSMPLFTGVEQTINKPTITNP